ncbi:MAG: hypothetical protein LBH59_03780 [Planctomycetaceae bacterium]|jgi:hypothetical protein|nr:hypothetical protein [Planctomycetaceae bacterium]
MKSKSIVISLGVLGCFVACAIIYAQVNNNNNNQLMPSVEVNARFASADRDGDGVLSKEEFANYFVKIQQVNLAGNATKSCCKEEGNKAETVSVKFSKDGEAKEGGCCGGKDKAKKADAKNNEKGCCKEESKTTTATTDQNEIKNDSTDLKPVAVVVTDNSEVSNSIDQQ